MDIINPYIFNSSHVKRSKIIRNMIYDMAIPNCTSNEMWISRETCAFHAYFSRKRLRLPTLVVQ